MQPVAKINGTSMIAALFTAIVGSLPVSGQQPDVTTHFNSWSEINLPFQSDRLIAGTPGTIITVDSRTNRLSLIDFYSKEVINTVLIPGRMEFLTEIPEAGVSGRVALVLLKESGPSFSLAVISVEDSKLVLSISSLKFDLSSYSRLRALPLFSDGLDGTSKNDVTSSSELADPDAPPLNVLIWESDRAKSFGMYVAWIDGVRHKFFLNAAPVQLLNIGISNVVLGLGNQLGRASLIDVANGSVLEVIAVSGSGSTASNEFLSVNALTSGGRISGVAFVDQQLGKLTVIPVQVSPTVNMGSSGGALGSLLQVNLPSGFGTTLAAGRDFSLVLVGSDSHRELAAYRRGKGGLEALSLVPLGIISPAITLAQGRSVLDPDIFAYLSEDGRVLHVSPYPALEHFIYKVSGGMWKEANSRIDQFRVARLDDLSPEEVAHLQRVLAGLNYEVGTIDGLSGTKTRAALQAFQIEHGISSNGDLTAETIAALKAGASSGLVGIPDDVARRYEEFLSRAVGKVDARNLLFLGYPHSDISNSCFGLNAPPPESLWSNSVAFANIMRYLHLDMGTEIEVVSGYRSPAYDACVREDLDTAHQRFQAFDIKIKPGEGDIGEDQSILVGAIEKLIEEGSVTADLKVNANGTIHVAPQLGAYHAAVASYSVNRRGCDLARDDVFEFSRLLADSALEGRELLIARSPSLDRYIVTVDMHSDHEASLAARSVIKSVSDFSSDGATGQDSVVIDGETLYLDPHCIESRIVPSFGGKLPVEISYDQREIDQIVSDLGSSDADVRRASRRALSQVLSEVTAPSVLESLTDNLVQQSYRVQLGIAVALSNAKLTEELPEEAIKNLQEALEQVKDDTLRSFLIHALPE